MQALNDEILHTMLQWQSKRYVMISSALDSTRRLQELSKNNDEEAIDLELDIRQSIIDGLRVMDEEFKMLTYGLDSDAISELLSKDYDEAGITPLQKALRRANDNSRAISYRLIGADKQFSLEYGKELSGYY